MQQEWIHALAGGALIGLAATTLLLMNGRVSGISGIFFGLFQRKSPDFLWQLFFVVGLLAGGITVKLSNPDAFTTTGQPIWVTLIAGLIVGFGTRLGSGCTSGHGVCGISRLSIRSIAATLSFICAGVLTVTIIRNLFRGLL